MSRLRQVGLDVEVPEEAAAPPAADAVGLGMLLLGLKTLSQRALAGARTVLTIASVASVWWLFQTALPANPSINQLVGLGLYSLFVLAVHRVAGR